MLIRYGDAVLIIDPNFSSRVGCVKRQEKPIMDPDVLIRARTILYTNPRLNRFEHASLKFFRQDTATIVSPPAVLPALKRFYHFVAVVAEPLRETVFDGVTVRALPARHVSLRFGRIHRQSFHFLLGLDGRHIFYASDCRYDPEVFRKIGDEHDITVAILPIDRVVPDALAGKNFMSVTDAVAAFHDLRAKIFVPNAFGAFVFPGRNPMTSRRELETEMENDRGLREKVKILNPGEEIELS